MTRYLALHHHAFTHPIGEEDRARSFYVGVLGLIEVTKPDTMNRLNGAWFRGDGVEIHAIPDPNFRPNRLGHPAFVVDDLDALTAGLRAAGVQVEPDNRFPGHRRVHSYDAFGNQLEFLEPLAEDLS